jgi:hypothetical protein
MQTRNIDSRRRSIGFYYCAIAAQQRVLQHNRHLADIGLRSLNVSFGGKAGIIGPEGQCLLLTQSGHRLCTAVMVLMRSSAPIEALV